MNCGQFLPILSSVDQYSAFGAFQFTPKNGNKVIIGGNAHVIPGGVAVISGGVPLDLSSCCIEKIPNQSVAANTLYYAYVFMDGQTMRLNLSAYGHKEDLNFGNEVHINDAGQSLVGMIRTNGSGRVVGGAQAQLMCSWFNPCRSVLFATLDGLETTSESFVAFSSSKLEYLLWGVNSSFTESLDHPNIFAKATLRNDIGKISYIAVAIDGSQNGLTGVHEQTDNATTQEPKRGCGDAVALSPGGGGKGEGYHYAEVMVRTSVGGTAKIQEGGLCTSSMRF